MIHTIDTVNRQWSPSERFEELLNSLLDETLSEADEAELAGLLAKSEAARRRYREWIELHASLHWDYAAAATPHRETTRAGEESLLSLATAADEAHTRRVGRGMMLVGASLSMAGLLALAISWVTVLQLPRGRAGHEPSITTPVMADSIVLVAAVDGAASWSDGGQVVSDLAIGNRLGAGTVSLDGDSAFMTLRFDDGTVVTLTGESMLEFDARWQKNLVLRHGSLSVNASPQPPGRPMLIRTPTAEVEVVGTIFSLSVDAQNTHVGVEEGSVRFLRLADGQSVAVNEQSVATASLVATRPLEVARPAAVPSFYKQSLVNAAGSDAGLKAEPYIAGRGHDGLPVIHYGCKVRSGDIGFVTVDEGSVISVRLRTATPETIRVMLSMRRPGGGFAGNFEAKIPIEAMPVVDGGNGAADGWRWIDIPIRDFLSLASDFPSLTPGHAVGLMLIDTFTAAANLEVAEVSVQRQAVETDAR
jgi:ferric-dicitrate binding protein FerR (iron transport regulator)